MKLGNKFAVVLSFVTASLAHPSFFKVKESIIPPRGWSQGHRAPLNHVIELRIGLPQPNIEALEDHLYQVSDPSHERYGNHLTKGEVEALVAPHPDSVEKVGAWLESHGCNMDDVSFSPAKDWMIVKVPISTAENMLNTNYHVWTHDDGESMVRTTSYSLPSELHLYIDLIQPTTLFSRFRRSSHTLHAIEDNHSASTATGTIAASNGAQINATCADTMTIPCLQQLYNFADYTASADNGNSIATSNYLGDMLNVTDLQTFYSVYVPAAVGTFPTIFTIVGNGTDESTIDGEAEANLDASYAFGISHPTKTFHYSTSGFPPFMPDDFSGNVNTNEPYATWLDFILSHDDPPHTITTSYGDDEQTVPLSFAQRVCSGFAQLGARGVSVIFSSGDFGVGDGDPDPSTQECIANDGTNSTRFLPTFPATCPYVTSVGATTGIPEVAVDFTGGGFSDKFSRPSYQAAAVKAYLNKLPAGTYAGLFNASGRGFPDVSAYGTNFAVFIQGVTFLVSGTSASSPTTAGIVALLNDARLNAGKSTLGFLNPLLYSKGVQGMNDITSGNNPGCGTEGFNATEGWDPLTGLGTPDFAKLKEIVLLS